MSAYNLSNIFPCPQSKATPPSSQSATPLPAGGEETDSEEWDQPEHNDW